MASPSIPHLPGGRLDRGRLVALALPLGSLALQVANARPAVARMGMPGSFGRPETWVALGVTFAFAWVAWRIRSPVIVALLVGLVAPAVAWVSGGLASIQAPAIPGDLVSTGFAVTPPSRLFLVELALCQTLLVLPSARLARSVALDAGHHRASLAGAWLVVVGAVTCFAPSAGHLVATTCATCPLEVESARRFAPLVGAGVATAGLFVLTYAQARWMLSRRWLVQVRAGLEPAWAVVPRRRTDAEAALPPLRTGSRPNALGGVLVHRDPGPREKPYRDGPIQTPRALVSLSPAKLPIEGA